ncbi:MAG: GNAT family N-acetyltransferase [Solirubrobacteraceae bacterium]|nr:GNAT family N-acetyltransferase [Solirubrobacteraceae bacterium]
MTDDQPPTSVAARRGTPPERPSGPGTPVRRPDPVGADLEPTAGRPTVERIHRVDRALRDRLLQIWTDVSNAGGWVGFVPPVTTGDVAPALDAALVRVHRGDDWLVVVRSGRRDAAATSGVAGFAFVAENDRLLSEHWRWVLRVQVHPEHQGEGLGVVLLDGIGRMADEFGLEMLYLTVRGGEGLEAFYARAGYREVARMPRAIRVAPGDDRDQVVLMHELRRPDDPAVGAGAA